MPTAPPLPRPHGPTSAGGTASAPICGPADAEGLPVPEASVSAGLAAACADGTVALYRQRGNGSLRRVPYLAPGHPAREVAEWFALRREAGASIATVAREANVSRVSVRRTLAALDLAEAVEDGDLDDLYDEGVTALVVAGDEDAE